ncbi:hypothetical protein ACG83_38020 [Frankia sp. R43]|nr:hypothetical protein ACG83_38020 [Frankia sp. R43]
MAATDLRQPRATALSEFACLTIPVTGSAGPQLCIGLPTVPWRRRCLPQRGAEISVSVSSLRIPTNPAHMPERGMDQPVPAIIGTEAAPPTNQAAA